MIFVPWMGSSMPSGELYLRFEGDFLDSSVAARTVTDHGATRSTAHPGGGSTEGMVGNGSYLSVVDDGFADIPRVEQYNLWNRWAYMGDRYVFQAGIKVLTEDRNSGQVGHGQKSG